MKALVTGSSGFIGTWLCEHLRTRGVDVVTVGRPTSVRSDHRVGDITDGSLLADVLHRISPDYVFHAAGTAKAATLGELYAVNTLYGAGLLSAVGAAAPGARVILFGSAAEYGDCGRDPADESMCPRPMTPYGISKLAQTMHGLAAARAGLKVTAVRLFNVVGPGQPPHLALGSWLQQLRQGCPSDGTLRLRTGGLDAWRDFVDVRAAVEALWRLAQSDDSVGQVINVCSGEAVQLKVLLERLLTVYGSPVAVESVPSQSAFDIPFSVGSTERLVRYAGLKPAGITDELLQRCLETRGADTI